MCIRDSPRYDWDALDAAVRGAAAHGLRVLFTVHAAPSWASRGTPSGPFIADPSAWRPDPEALGDFATALASRYSGTFRPIGAATALPRVSLIEPWNEPNLTAFLAPQWEDGRIASVDIYRELLNSVYAAYHAVQPDAKVIAGTTAPDGDPGVARRLAPLVFLRELLCVRKANFKAKPCPEKARFDALSHHPINPSNRRPAQPAAPDDAGIAEMKGIGRMLHAAERQHTVLPDNETRPLWATEFWWETSPPTTLYEAASLPRQAANVSESLRLLWKAHVPVALWFQVRDDTDVSGPPRTGWGTGILTANGDPKPAFQAFQMPFVADRVSRRKSAVWVRSPAAGMVRIKAGKGGDAKVIATYRVSDGDVVSDRIAFRGAAEVRARVAGTGSLSNRVPRKPN